MTLSSLELNLGEFFEELRVHFSGKIFVSVRHLGIEIHLKLLLCSFSGMSLAYIWIWKRHTVQPVFTHSQRSFLILLHPGPRLRQKLLSRSVSVPWVFSSHPFLGLVNLCSQGSVRGGSTPVPHSAQLWAWSPVSAVCVGETRSSRPSALRLTGGFRVHLPPICEHTLIQPLTHSILCCSLGHI